MDLQRCSVTGCDSVIPNNSNIVLFNFPSDPVLAAKWAHSLHLDVVPSEATRATFKVCSLHFEEHWLTRIEDPPMVLLLQDSVPFLDRNSRRLLDEVKLDENSDEVMNSSFMDASKAPRKLSAEAAQYRHWLITTSVRRNEVLNILARTKGLSCLVKCPFCKAKLNSPSAFVQHLETYCSKKALFPVKPGPIYCKLELTVRSKDACACELGPKINEVIRLGIAQDVYFYACSLCGKTVQVLSELLLHLAEVHHMVVLKTVPPVGAPLEETTLSFESLSISGGSMVLDSGHDYTCVLWQTGEGEEELIRGESVIGAEKRLNRNANESGSFFEVVDTPEVIGEEVIEADGHNDEAVPDEQSSSSDSEMSLLEYEVETFDREQEIEEKKSLIKKRSSVKPKRGQLGFQAQIAKVLAELRLKKEDPSKKEAVGKQKVRRRKSTSVTPTESDGDLEVKDRDQDDLERTASPEEISFEDLLQQSEKAKAESSGKTGGICRHCKKHFGSFRRVLEHVAIVHNSFECPKCGRSFDDLTELLTHFLVNVPFARCAEQGQRQLDLVHCEFCPSAVSVANLQTHMSKVHSSFRCLKCKLQMATHDELWRHNVMEHHGHGCALITADNQLIFKCRRCDADFATYGAYNAHLHGAGHLLKLKESRVGNQNEKEELGVLKAGPKKRKLGLQTCDSVATGVSSGKALKERVKSEQVNFQGESITDGNSGLQNYHSLNKLEGSTNDWTVSDTQFKNLSSKPRRKVKPLRKLSPSLAQETKEKGVSREAATAFNVKKEKYKPKKEAPKLGKEMKHSSKKTVAPGKRTKNPVSLSEKVKSMEVSATVGLIHGDHDDLVCCSACGECVTSKGFAWRNHRNICLENLHCKLRTVALAYHAICPICEVKLAANEELCTHLTVHNEPPEYFGVELLAEDNSNELPFRPGVTQGVLLSLGAAGQICFQCTRCGDRALFDSLNVALVHLRIAHDIQPFFIDKIEVPALVHKGEVDGGIEMEFSALPNALELTDEIDDEEESARKVQVEYM